MHRVKQEEKNRRILLTGGHGATTAIAVVEELIRRQEKEAWEIYWVGSRYALEGKHFYSFESVYLPKLKVKCRHIISGRLQRKFSFWTLPAFLKIPLGFIHAFFLLRQIKPQIVLSFGGYAAFPVVVMAWLLRIPVILHEQTASAGRANLKSSFFVKKIALARKESKKYFSSKKRVCVGNPIMTQIAEVPVKTDISRPPVLMVVGGSRGSQRVNLFITPILKKLLRHFYLIHQTGELDYEKFLKIRKALGNDLSRRYEIYKYIDPMQIDGVYKRADIILARAGANTVSEIMVVKRPSILIPIPFSFLNEQEENAKVAEKFGIAQILKQDETSPEKLLKAIFKLVKNWEDMIKKVKSKKNDDIFAASRLVNLVLKEINAD